MAPPNKLLVEYIADFVRDEAVRCQSLRHEWEGPKAYGLDDLQVEALNSFDWATIFEKAAAELEEINVDLAAKLVQISGGNPPGGGVGPANIAKSMYGGGQIHIRELDPPAAAANQSVQITLLGNGFEAHPEVYFTPKSGALPLPTVQANAVQGAFVKHSCDVDLYQRVTVSVTLAAGEWWVQARNLPTEDLNTGDVGTLQVG